MLLYAIVLIIGACLGAGVVGLCVAARAGHNQVDVARFLTGLQFSSENHGRSVLLDVGDFNQLALLAALANQPRAWLNAAEKNYCIPLNTKASGRTMPPHPRSAS